VAVDAVIKKFIMKVIFLYIQNITSFDIRIYKLCVRYGHTFNMSYYLGKQRDLAHTKAACVTVHPMEKRCRITSVLNICD
jgi:hypothetical protein